MPSASKWGTSPRESVEAQCERLGTEAVVSGCIALLTGHTADPGLILALGGRPARWAAGYDEPAGPAYWLRVWAARGLLWAWDARATPAILTALDDEAWRVREMGLKVAVRHHLGDALPAAHRLRNDPNARVRKAAERAVIQLSAD
jgi:hypothetical protein